MCYTRYNYILFLYSDLIRRSDFPVLVFSQYSKERAIKHPIPEGTLVVAILRYNVRSWQCEMQRRMVPSMALIIAISIYEQITAGGWSSKRRAPQEKMFSKYLYIYIGSYVERNKNLSFSIVVFLSHTQHQTSAITSGPGGA